MLHRLSKTFTPLMWAHVKMNFGAVLVAEALFKERAFKEQLLYQGKFSLHL